MGRFSGFIFNWSPRNNPKKRKFSYWLLYFLSRITTKGNLQKTKKRKFTIPCWILLPFLPYKNPCEFVIRENRWLHAIVRWWIFDRYRQFATWIMIGESLLYICTFRTWRRHHMFHGLQQLCAVLIFSEMAGLQRQEVLWLPHNEWIS